MPRDEIVQRCMQKKDAFKSKRRQEQANYFNINHISTMLNYWPLSSLLGSSWVAE